jgi:hypothetical protein
MVDLLAATSVNRFVRHQRRPSTSEIDIYRMSGRQYTRSLNIANEFFIYGRVPMKRGFDIAIAIILVSSVIILPTSAQQQESRKDERIIQRLDDILQRLESIEERLTKLEDDKSFANESWVDKRWVVRNIHGRPMGFWGIDGLPSTQLR